MTSKPIARNYTPADKAACLAIFDGNTPPYFDPSERPLFESFLDDPRGPYLVLEQHDAIVGCGGFAREDDGTTISFTWGMVDRSQHKSGLGRLLTEVRLQRISALDNVQSIQLNTTPQIAPFFEHMGFRRTRFEADGYAPGMDKVTMEKSA
jgi:GNAT superfamily N-acetyltransferase